MVYQFKYITVKELEKLKEEHPVVYKESSKYSFEKIKSCPDINSNFPCFFYLLNEENEIVCSLKAIPDIVWAGGKKYPWAWLGALFTDELHRGKGLGTRIALGSRNILHQNGIAWGGAFSTPIALHIYKKLGFSLPGYANRYLMIKSIRPFLEVHIKSRFITGSADLLYRSMIWLIYKCYYRKRLLKTFNVKTINLSEEDIFNISLPKIFYETKVHFNDDLKKLLWKTRGSNEKTGNNCSLLLIKEITNNEPICYFIIRMKNQIGTLEGNYKDCKLMTLMDFGFYRNDIRIYSTMLNIIIKLFLESEADVLETISNSRLFASVMKRMGMIKIGKGMSFTFSVPENWNWDQEYNKLENWKLTHFCGDGFSF